ncbi:MAG: hypothetical protein GKR91_07130 [Pseudomonadales bacterium]|nr:hypothetical protein [Pseudomonadales bacterium]
MATKLATIMFTLGLTIFSATAAAQIENPFIGTWDIDLAESNFGSAAPPVNMSRTYADLGDGSFMYLVVTINDDGSLSGNSASYSYSGEQYPIASLDQLAAAQISYRRINDRTVEYTVRIDSEVSQIGAKSISPNGQLLTIAIQFPDSTQENQILRFNRRR